MSLPVVAGATSSASRLAIALILITLYGSSLAQSQDVLTYHNNNLRNGLDNKEQILTLSNVKSATFGKLFTVSADGIVDAEPLFLSAIRIGAVTHNLLIVATEHDSVYAFDADTGAPIWHVRTLDSGEIPSDNRSCNQVTPEIGITSTPVIVRPATGNPVIYAVAMSKDASGHYHQRLHALDATTGKELHGGPVEITAEYPGAGDNSSFGKVIFDPAQYKERAGLLLLGPTAYLAWASHCDHRPFTGWIMGYDINTLTQTTVLNLTPNGHDGAIWGSGAGMAADNSGNIFLLDGNGTFDTSLNSAGFPAKGDYGNAFLRLGTTNGLAVTDYFEMANQSQENNNDIDLGSGGTVLTSRTDSPGHTTFLAIGAGKDSNLYVVDRDNMGKFSSTANHIYQELAGALPSGVFAMPALYGGNLYYGPVHSPLLSFRFSGATLLPTPVAKSAHIFPYPGTTPIISANGGQNAIIWTTENTNVAVLRAFDAQTLKEIYNSDQAPNNRDHFGAGNKFGTPMIANGRVYVATKTGVGVFGLLK